jgi:hypothetical protein
MTKTKEAAPGEEAAPDTTTTTTTTTWIPTPGAPVPASGGLL